MNLIGCEKVEIYIQTKLLLLVEYLYNGFKCSNHQQPGKFSGLNLGEDTLEKF